MLSLGAHMAIFRGRGKQIILSTYLFLINNADLTIDDQEIMFNFLKSRREHFPLPPPYKNAHNYLSVKKIKNLKLITNTFITRHSYRIVHFFTPPM